MPGFIDAHSHYINSLLVANQSKLYAPPSGPGKDVPSIIAELKKFAEERNIPKGELIMGYGYDDSVMPDGRLLNRDDLDEAFPDNPVRIDHVSMHGAVMNSLALKKYGISAETKTPPGGVIVRKPGTEEPWGLIMETAFLPVMEQSEPMTAQQEIEWTRAGQMLYAEAGITTAHEGATHLPQLQTIKRASEAGANIIDVVAYPFITDVDKVLAELPVTEWGKYKNRFKIGGVKITLDGSPQGRTAFFTTPYLTGGPGGEKNWKGEPTFPQDLANKMVKKVYDLNVPLILHCNGDAAIDAFLTAYEFARDGDYSRPWNVTTIHTQFMRKDQIPKFVKYKVRPSFYTLHTFYFADTHIANRGKAQAHLHQPDARRDRRRAAPDQPYRLRCRPARSDDDALVGGESGFPRRRRGGTRPTRDTLRGSEDHDRMGRRAIWRSKIEGNPGSRQARRPRDPRQDPLKVDPMAIKDIKVVETIKEGETIYPGPAGGIKPPVGSGQKPERSIPGDPHLRHGRCEHGGAQGMDADHALREEYQHGETSDDDVFTWKALGLRRHQPADRFLCFGPNTVTMSDLASTKMAGPPELMELEGNFAKMLRGVDSFKVSGNELMLLTEGNIVAVFHSSE